MHAAAAKVRKLRATARPSRRANRAAVAAEPTSRTCWDRTSAQRPGHGRHVAAAGDQAGRSPPAPSGSSSVGSSQRLWMAVAAIAAWPMATTIWSSPRTTAPAA